jgi:hypothetical protein
MEPVYSSFDPIQSIAVTTTQTAAALLHRTHISIIRLHQHAVDDLGTAQTNFKGNFTLTDVAWCPAEDGRLAVAATNGSIAIMDIPYSTGENIVCI